MTDRTESEHARAMLDRQRPVDHPVITRCTHGSHLQPSFAEGSPYLFLHPEKIELLARALRDDVSLMTLEPARKVFRRVDPAEGYPVPESCTPYVDANGLGFYFAPFLPIVFVRTTRGEPLLEARVALKYLCENRAKFSEVLGTIERHACRLFRPEVVEGAAPKDRNLFADIVQPYGSFTAKHLSLRAGLWVHTPPGVSTVIGPLVNQRGPLSIVSGAIETDWHHFELFVVAEFPEFEGQVLIIEPGTPIAQLHFAARRAQEEAEIRFSTTDPGADPDYAASWDSLGERLVREGKGKAAERKGVASIQLGCPHCYVSVTAAAEGGVPEDHVVTRGFNPAYKVLQHENRARREPGVP